MFDFLRTWRNWREGDSAAWQPLLRWAREQRFIVKRVRDGSGLVVLGASRALKEMPWRLEWGASQRSYLTGHELRLRMELGLPQDMHAMVVSQGLRERLEAQAFEDWTHSNRTLVASQTPEESRWVALYPTVKAFTSARLARRMAVFCPSESLAKAWMGKDLEAALSECCDQLFEGDAPFVLMILRGRLYLRVQCAEPEWAKIRDSVHLLEVAAASACRAASSWAPSAIGRPDSGDSSWLMSGLTGWNSELPPQDLSTMPMPLAPDEK